MRRRTTPARRGRRRDALAIAQSRLELDRWLAHAHAQLAAELAAELARMGSPAVGELYKRRNRPDAVTCDDVVGPSCAGLWGSHKGLETGQ